MKNISCSLCKHCIRYEIQGMIKNRCDIIEKDLTRNEVRHHICNSFKPKN